jgi:cobaltochelatase CobN
LLFLSTSDTDLLALRRTAATLPGDFGEIDCRNPARLALDEVDRLVDAVTEGGVWAVCLRLLGGRKAFMDGFGFDRLRRAATDSVTPFLAWPGERGQDLELEAASSCAPGLLALGARYLEQGGIENVGSLLRALSDTLRGTSYSASPPREMPQHGIYLPGQLDVMTATEWKAGQSLDRPVVAIAFYRAHWMSGNLDFVDALSRAVEEAGGEPLPFFCYSLRDPGPTGLPAAVAECLIRSS